THLAEVTAQRGCLPGSGGRRAGTAASCEPSGPDRGLDRRTLLRLLRRRHRIPQNATFMPTHQGVMEGQAQRFPNAPPPDAVNILPATLEGIDDALVPLPTGSLHQHFLALRA